MKMPEAPDFANIPTGVQKKAAILADPQERTKAIIVGGAMLADLYGSYGLARELQEQLLGSYFNQATEISSGINSQIGGRRQRRAFDGQSPLARGIQILDSVATVYKDAISKRPVEKPLSAAQLVVDIKKEKLVPLQVNQETIIEW